MGYCVDIYIRNVIIPLGKRRECLKAINDLWADGPRSFAWVMNRPEGGYTKLAEALEDWRYSTMRHGQDLILDSFTGEKWGDDEVLFNTIAPFVTGVGYIAVNGSDGESWQYRLADGDISQREGLMVYGRSPREATLETAVRHVLDVTENGNNNAVGIDIDMLRRALQ
jgi:hypothetical protein